MIKKDSLNQSPKRSVEDVFKFINISIYTLQTSGVEDEDIIISIPPYLIKYMEGSSYFKTDAEAKITTYRDYRVTSNPSDSVVVFMKGHKKSANKKLSKKLVLS